MHPLFIVTLACTALPCPSPPADKYNSFLGKGADTACETCEVTDPRFTSYPGADYCTVPYVDTTCGNGELAWHLG